MDDDVPPPFEKAEPSFQIRGTLIHVDDSLVVYYDSGSIAIMDHGGERTVRLKTGAYTTFNVVNNVLHLVNVNAKTYTAIDLIAARVLEKHQIRYPKGETLVAAGLIGDEVYTVCESAVGKHISVYDGTGYHVFSTRLDIYTHFRTSWSSNTCVIFGLTDGNATMLYILRADETMDFQTYPRIHRFGCISPNMSFVCGQDHQDNSSVQIDCLENKAFQTPPGFSPDHAGLATNDGYVIIPRVGLDTLICKHGKLCMKSPHPNFSVVGDRVYRVDDAGNHYETWFEK